MHPLTVVVVIAMQVAVAPASSAEIVSDPLAAVRALYASKDGAGLNSVYQMASRRLRQTMMARSLCTVPRTERAIVCTDTARLLGSATEISETSTDPRAGVRTIFVRRETAEPGQISFRFVRAGAGWQLQDIGAPGVADWPFTPLSSGAIDVPLRHREPATEVPTPFMSDAPAVRRADRQRRLTRQN